MIINMGNGIGNNNKSLLVYTNAGAIVTATKGSKTIQKIADARGSVAFCVSKGTWTITCTDNGLTEISTIVISEDNTLNMLLNMIPTFTYTGTYELVDDDDNIITSAQENWKIRFLTSGKLVFSNLNGAENGIDVFCVGGGSGGNNYACAGGGGGGYTTTELNKPITIDTEYNIVVGDGGLGATEHQAMGGSGGETSAFGVVALGAENPVRHYPGYTNGGNGGSGGGSGGIVVAAEDLYVINGSGGKDGSNGEGTFYGNGQGTTTREFGEFSGKLYATGGNGADSGKGLSGTPNTGNGGDGYCDGGSGIVVIRNVRPYKPYIYYYNQQATQWESVKQNMSVGGGTFTGKDVTVAYNDNGILDVRLYPYSHQTDDGIQGDMTCGLLRTVNDFDLTNYKTITIKCSVPSGNFSFAQLIAYKRDGNPSTPDASVAIPDSYSGEGLSMDVSSLEGEYAIGIRFVINPYAYGGGAPVAPFGVVYVSEIIQYKE